MNNFAGQVVTLAQKRYASVGATAYSSMRSELMRLERQTDVSVNDIVNVVMKKVKASGTFPSASDVRSFEKEVERVL